MSDWRCNACDRFKSSSDGENYDAVCECGHIHDSHRRRLEAAIWTVIDDLEITVSEHEPSRGGQHVPRRYPLGQQTPSGLFCMRRLALDLRSALRGEWPMLREEYASKFPDVSAEYLDLVFPKRVT